MDILQVLREAKDPQENKGLVIEDDKDTGYNSGLTPIGGDTQREETPAEEPTEAAPETPANEPETPGADDQDAQGENTPAEAEDPNITEPTDYSADPLEMDAPTDDSMDADQSASDTSGNDYSSSQEEPQEEDAATIANKRLLNDFVDLYYSIGNNIKKLDEMESLDIVSNQIIIKSKHNLTKLHTYTYKYIVYYFSKGSYADNLYVFKNIIELYKIAVEMVRKIGK